MNFSHKNTNHHKEQFPFLLTHHLKGNWTINFQVCSMRPLKFYLRESHSHCKRETNSIACNKTSMLLLTWENFTSIHVKSFWKISCLSPSASFISIETRFGKSVRCDYRLACKMHRPLSKLWCVLASCFPCIKILICLWIFHKRSLCICTHPENYVNQCKWFEIFNTRYEKYKYLNKYITIHNKIRLDVT